MLGYEVDALHCNFHLRGEESDADETFVRKLCQQLKVELRVKHFDTEAYAKAKGLSIEMAARELRYQWFQEERERQGIEQIAVAHNADDMVETLLLNLSMGTGIRGLSGMPYKRHDGIIRPLMNVSRQEILSFLSDLKQSYREDRSNTSLAYRRNYIRHKLIPCFEEINPNFRKTTLDTISNLRGTEAVYLSTIKDCKSLITEKGIEISALLETVEPKTVLFELLYPYGFSREQILELAANLKHLRRGATYTSEKYRLLVSRHYLEILPNSSTNAQSFSINISKAGAITLPHGELAWQEEDSSTLKSLVCPQSEVIFDAQSLRNALGESSELILSSKADGDRIKAFGMQRGSKRVSRVFIDGGLTHKEREDALLLRTTDNQVLWIVNVLASSHYTVSKSTKKVLHFYFKKS